MKAHSHSFDSLKLTQHLQRHGFANNQAEGLSEAFSQVSTTIVDDIRVDIKALDGKVTKLEDRIDGLENRLGSVENRVGSLEVKVVQLDHKMDIGFKELDSKIDLTALQTQNKLIKWMVGINFSFLTIFTALFGMFALYIENLVNTLSR
jgi:hypothetical protein